MNPTYDDIGIKKEKLEDHYDIKEELGRGQFAVVKKCTRNEDGIEVAAKYVKVKRSKSSRNGLSKDAIQREAWILKSLDHEKVIKLYDTFDLGSEMVLVLELLSGGELFDKICELEYLTEVDACLYMKQVLEAIQHLHDNQIVHLDIKPENIVLKTKDSCDIKLVDFGLAQKLYPGHDLKEMMGTPEFVAPEIINYETIGLYTDMWALGVLAYILLSGCSPFLGDNNQETYENIIKVDYNFEDEYFDTISESAKELVSSLLIKAPNKRSTVKECLDHPWIQTMSTTRDRVNSSVIATDRFKAFVARRRWQQSFQKLNAITRFSKFLKKGATLKQLNEQAENHTPSTNQTNVHSDTKLGFTQSEENSEIDVTNESDSSKEYLFNGVTHEKRKNSIGEVSLDNKDSVDSAVNKAKVKISITTAPDFDNKPRSGSLLDSPKHAVRKESLASKLGPSQRRYSREDPVRYTEQLKDMISQRINKDNQNDSTITEEKELNESQVSETTSTSIVNQNEIHVSIKDSEDDLLDIANNESVVELKHLESENKENTEEIETESASETKHVNVDTDNELAKTDVDANNVKVDTDDQLTKTDVDVNNIVAYDIRENSEVKTSIRQKSTISESSTNSEKSTTSIRTRSISESRKAFILGPQTSSNNDGLVNLSKRRSLKLEASMMKSLQENKGVEIKVDEKDDDVFQNNSGNSENIDTPDAVNSDLKTETETTQNSIVDNETGVRTDDNNIHDTTDFKISTTTTENKSQPKETADEKDKNENISIQPTDNSKDPKTLQNINSTENKENIDTSDNNDKKTPNGITANTLQTDKDTDKNQKVKKKKEKSTGCSCVIV